MKTSHLCLLGLLISGIHGTTASAGPLSWQFNTPHYTVSSTDSILVTATVFNDSDLPVTFDSAGAIFAGDFQKIFDFTPLFDFVGKSTPAHGSLLFTFGSLSPVGGMAPEGVYVADPASIRFVPSPDLIPSLNGFDVTVVPEPTLVGLAALGLFALSLQRRCRNRA